jgi:FkbM family methyltransferase
MVLRGDVWERQTIEFMRANTCGRDVIHAGTYFGDFLPGLSSAASGTIYAFEPNSENFTCAEWTTVLNSLQNVRLHHAALGESNSERLMQVAQNGHALGGLSHIVASSSAPDGRGGDFEDITTVRLDDVLPPDADVGIVQLDVEGFEEPALKGALQTITRCRPIMILETAPRALLDAQILPLGYQQAGAVCGNAIFRI